MTGLQTGLHPVLYLGAARVRSLRTLVGNCSHLSVTAGMALRRRGVALDRPSGRSRSRVVRRVLLLAEGKPINIWSRSLSLAVGYPALAVGEASGGRKD
jgi:hypothetical protein